MRVARRRWAARRISAAVGGLPDVSGTPPAAPVDFTSELAAAAAAVAEPSAPSSLASVLSTVQTVLESAHTWSGLPWWATIFAGTIALKVGVFPLTIFQLRNTRRMVDAQPDLQKLRTAFSGALGRHARADALERSSKVSYYFSSCHMTEYFTYLMMYY